LRKGAEVAKWRLPDVARGGPSVRRRMTADLGRTLFASDTGF